MASVAQPSIMGVAEMDCRAALAVAEFIAFHGMPFKVCVQYPNEFGKLTSGQAFQHSRVTQRNTQLALEALVVEPA